MSVRLSASPAVWSFASSIRARRKRSISFAGHSVLLTLGTAGDCSGRSDHHSRALLQSIAAWLAEASVAATLIVPSS